MSCFSTAVWDASAVFRKLLPLGHDFNVRIIAINQRDYPGSRPLSKEEVEPLTRSGNDAIDGFKSFMRDRATELLQFIHWLVDEAMVKPFSKTGSRTDGKASSIVGGVAVIGWSSGNRFLQAILANLQHFPDELIGKLNPYMRGLMVYGMKTYILRSTQVI